MGIWDINASVRSVKIRTVRHAGQSFTVLRTIGVPIQRTTG